MFRRDRFRARQVDERKRGGHQLEHKRCASIGISTSQGAWRMSKRRKEAEVIVFEEPKFKKRKSEKEFCRVSQKPEVCIIIIQNHVIRVQTCHSCSRAGHHRVETAPAASLSDSRLRSWTLRQHCEKSRNMVSSYIQTPAGLKKVSIFT